MLPGQALARPAREDFGGDFNGVEVAAKHRLTQVVEQLAQAGQQRFASIALGQWLAGWMTQQTVDGRQPQGLAGHQGFPQTLMA
ncbi:hypothetical protein D3C85_1647670 [compost metagenome]